MDNSDIQTKSGAVDELDEDEYQVFQILKPYIYTCLSFSHDINNPLAGIMGFAELLKEESNDMSESQIKLINRVLECAEKIKSSVNQLCDIKDELTNKVKNKNILEAYREEAQSQ